MSATKLKQVNTKLKQLPETLLGEVERFIDFLNYKHKQDSDYIAEWQKDIVLNRVNEAKEPIDAFEMLDDLENE